MPRHRCASVLIPIVAATALSSHADEKLATVPDGITIASDLVPRDERGSTEWKSTLVFRGDGKAVAYVGRKGEQWFPIVGSTVHEPYVGVLTPVFAGDRAVFVVVKNASKDSQRFWVWIDGKKLGAEDWIQPVGASPDGRKLAYWTQPGAKVGSDAPAPIEKDLLAIAALSGSDSWTVSRGSKWSRCGPRAPRFSTDGVHVFTTAKGPKGVVVIDAGTKEAAASDPCAAIDSFAISLNGQALAVVRLASAPNGASFEPRKENAPELYFQKKRVGRAFAIVTSPTVDAEGKHVAYAASSNGGMTVAIDDEKTPPGAFEHVLDLTFDPTGKKVAFIALAGGTASERAPGSIEGGERFVVVRDIGSGAELVEHERFQDVHDLVWDEKGERLAYCARTSAGWTIVCGELRSDPHDEVGRPAFKGDRIEYGSRDASELWWRSMPLR